MMPSLLGLDIDQQEPGTRTNPSQLGFGRELSDPRWRDFFDRLQQMGVAGIGRSMGSNRAGRTMDSLSAPMEETAMTPEAITPSVAMPQSLSALRRRT